MRDRAYSVVLIVATLLASSGAHVAAYPRPGVTERVSTPPGGRDAEDPNAPFAPASDFPSMSTDGRYVAFSSSANDLVQRDSNLMTDVFVRDRKTHGTDIVSIASNGNRAVGVPTQPGVIPGSGQPSISGSGRYVAFPSAAINLVSGDTNGQTDVFVHDRKKRETERVSVPTGGGQADGPAIAPSISTDGRYVAFESLATNLVRGDSNERSDVFIHDRKSGRTERVSATVEGDDGDDESLCPSLGRTGRYVAFTSWAQNLAPTPGGVQVFLRDRKTSKIELVSEPLGGPEGKPALQQGSQACPLGGHSVSANGRFVVFQSHMPDLVPNNSNSLIPGIGNGDVFVRDRKSGEVERVSVTSAGEAGNNSSLDPTISPDGRYVSFASLAVLSSEQPPVVPDLPGCCNQIREVFVHDRKLGLTEWISKAVDGLPPSDTFMGSQYPVVSSDGRFVAFQSDGEGLVDEPNVASSMTEVYVRSRGSDLGIGELVSLGRAERIEVAENPGFVRTGVAQVPVATDRLLSSPLDAGVTISRARVLYRPMVGDLFVRLRLEDPPAGGEFRTRSAGLIHVLSFDADGQKYELRAGAHGVARDGSLEADFRVFSCETEDPLTCREIDRLQGGFGTTGKQIVASLPLEKIGVGEGSVLSDLVAYSTLAGIKR